MLATEAIFDAFMRLDANYQSVPPAQCMRIINFSAATDQFRQRSLSAHARMFTSG